MMMLLLPCFLGPFAGHAIYGSAICGPNLLTEEIAHKVDAFFKLY
jgi:hypothetical protein